VPGRHRSCQTVHLQRMFHWLRFQTAKLRTRQPQRMVSQETHLVVRVAGECDALQHAEAAHLRQMKRWSLLRFRHVLLCVQVWQGSVAGG